MKRSALLVAIFSTVMTLVLPFLGGSGPSLVSSAPAYADTTSWPVFASDPQTAADSGSVSETARPTAADRRANVASGAQQRRDTTATIGLSCPMPVSGRTASAPTITAGEGLITGTTSDDLAAFAEQYNAIRVDNCLQPVPLANIRYDACLETRLVWMAEDPSTDPASAWGHLGSMRSDGVDSVGCDGNLAGGSGDSAATVAQKWWNSDAHRDSLYEPDYAGATAGVCVYFAMTHGGVPNEAYSFSRASASWGEC